MIKKHLLKTTLIASICAMMMVSVTGCSSPFSKSDKKDDTTIEQTSKTTYDTPKSVVKAFWTSMSDVDRDLMESCFYSKSDAQADIDKNIELAKTTGSYTDIHVKDIEFEDKDGAEDIIKDKGYKKFDDSARYTVTVPMTQVVDSVTYEVNDIYDMTVVCIKDCWYVVTMDEIDAVIISTDADVNDVTTEDPIVNLPEDVITTEDDTTTPDIDTNITPAEGFSTTYADKSSRCFALNGKTYTVGVTTLQELIDDGVVFRDISNANNNIKPNYESEDFVIYLNDDEYFSCQICVGNFTDENKTIAECPITSFYLPVKTDVPFVENTLQFAFPLTLTEAELRANSGEPSDFDEYISDDGNFTSHTLEYEWEGTKYIGNSGYRFEYMNGELKYLYITYKP